MFWRRLCRSTATSACARASIRRRCGRNAGLALSPRKASGASSRSNGSLMASDKHASPPETGLAHPITFGGIEKKHLVCLGYGLVVPNMTHVDAAIRKNKFRRGCPLFRTLVSAPALAAHVPNRNRRRFQQKLNGNLRHVFSLGPFHMLRFSWIGGELRICGHVAADGLRAEVPMTLLLCQSGSSSATLSTPARVHADSSCSFRERDRSVEGSSDNLRPLPHPSHTNAISRESPHAR